VFLVAYDCKGEDMDLSHVLTFLGGLLTGYTIKVAISIYSTKSNSNRIVSQHHNKAGGDIVAGDSTKTN
jgi:hypothetical protein